ncbi:MAG: cysteine--tRNA ligase, partial [Clostridia bacterium]|nr:cysteine--tRNA ligase [Clostridia bacterium]
LHLNTNTGKMSKSSGEFLTVSLLEEKGYNPLVYRLFCLQSHYRKSLVFSWEGMESTKTAYNKLVSRIANLKLDDASPVDEAKFGELKQRFTDAMDNDLNTVLAVTAVYDVLKSQTNDATKVALIRDFDRVLSLGLLEEAAKVKKAAEIEAAARAKAAENATLTITFTGDSVDPELSAKVEELITRRADAKKAKDFAAADAIRDELTAMGVVLKDAKDSVSWSIA